MADIVRVRTNLSNAELTECVCIVADFFSKNRDEVKRTMGNFPDASTKPKVLEMVLREGLGRLEDLNDYEDDTKRLQEMDEMHDEAVFVYGSDYCRCEYKKD